MNVLNGSFYLYAKYINFKKNNENIHKIIKKLLPESIDVIKKYKHTKEIVGLLSFLPEKDCFLIYKAFVNHKKSSIVLEFSGFGDIPMHDINKYKIICKGICSDLKFYLNLNLKIKMGDLI